MAEPRFPILLFAANAGAERDNLNGGGTPPRFPSNGRQQARIAPKFKALQDTFESKRLILGAAAPAQDPDMVIVFETIGSIDNFIKAVRRIEGLEWLFDSEEEDLPPDDDFYFANKPNKSLPSRLYLIGSNQAALNQIESLWRRYQADPAVRLEVGLAPWKHVFEQLRDVRPWGIADRLNLDVEDYWRDQLAVGADPIKFEIDVWHFTSDEKNQRAYSDVSHLIADLGGRTLSRLLLNEISYHGLLVEMPAASIEALLSQAPPSLVLSDRIMFFRPQGQALAPKGIENVGQAEHIPPAAIANGDPIVALLDGLPIQNHPLLEGRLVVDDPDGWAEDYLAEERSHGTAMASLIVHGDLGAEEVLPLQRPIYVRPVLKPNGPRGQRFESTPDDILLVDMMHRAVKRMAEGDNGEAPAAPSVRVVNISLGDISRPFDRIVSPWARLLDWLSFKYRLLFIVSTGNVSTKLTLPIPRESLAQRTDIERHRLALQAVFGLGASRPLLAPAETVNGITVGAHHFDHSIFQPARRFDLFRASGLSPFSRIGNGFKRSIKPDLLFAGGRLLFQEEVVGPQESTTLTPIDWASIAPGQKVASPLSGALNTTFSRGTSNATALATRGAARVFEVVEQLRAQAPDRLPPQFDAVLLKALLTHGASWGELIAQITEAVPEMTDRDQQRSFAARWLGYGPVNLERALSCTAERATMVGVGELGADQAIVFTAPLPPSLAGTVQWRRLTVTLAWLSPINCGHQAYRRARLWISPPGDKLSVARREGEWRQVQRGTLQHEVLEGENALAFVDGDTFLCKVNCKADAGDLSGNVPFALCISLEVAEGVGIPIYLEMRDRIRPRVEVTG